MKPRGLFVGSTAIDIHYNVDTFPTANQKMNAKAFTMTLGGPATNAAITFAYLGGSCHLLTAVGQNPFTPYIESELQQYNVRFTNLAPTSAQLPVISSIVTTPGGLRSVVTTRPAFASLINEATWITQRSDYDMVLVDGLNMEACYNTALQARQHGIPVVLDAGSWKEGMERLLPSVDIAICSENFYPPGESEQGGIFAYLAQQGVRYNAITRGERPINYRTPDSAGEMAIEPVEAVDTLGAGDILHGAFCYYFAERNEFVPALLQASRIATLSCQFFGTRAWMTQ